MASPTLQRERLTAPEVDYPAQEIRQVNKRRRAISSAWFIVLSCGEVAADWITVFSAVFIAYALYHYLGLGQRVQYPFSRVAAIGIAFGFIVTLLLDRTGAYRIGNSLLRIRETERILKVSFQSSFIAFAASYLSNVSFPRWFLSLTLISVPVFLIIEKHIAGTILSILRSRGYGTRRVLVYGAGFTGRRLFSAIVRSPKLGLEPVAFLDDNPKLSGSTVFEKAYNKKRCTTVVNGPLTEGFLREQGIDLVLVAIPSICREKFAEISQTVRAAGSLLSCVPYHHDASLQWVDYSDIDGTMVADLHTSAPDGRYGVVKRAFDVVFVSLLMLVLCPFVLVLFALIRLTSPGPALFVQQRVGRHGKLFRLYKFRTMYLDSGAYDYSPTDTGDPRITKIGRYLRRTSLDELPQLLNILKGEMSLVGPRPEMPFIVDQYSALHRQRLQAIPGLTGLWQLSADRAHLIHENIEYDLYYMRHCSFFMDVAILLHTLVFAARGV